MKQSGQKHKFESIKHKRIHALKNQKEMTNSEVPTTFYGKPQQIWYEKWGNLGSLGKN